jgi:putative YhdH/YhfP family quinone oxidoreductase
MDTLPSTFSAFVVTRSGDSIDASVRALGPDDLGDGEVTLAVDWSAVNYKDAMVTRPGNRVARISPLIPGVDLVGTVLDSGDTSLQVGGQVVVQGYDLGVAHHGGFSELARVPAGWVVPLPSGLSARQAATIGTAGFTAALSLRRLEHQGLSPGDGPVLVTGASGGVGSMAVSLLATRGYEVVASTGKADEQGYLRALGASQVIGREELFTEPGRTLGAERWVGAVDCVGGPTLSAILRTLRYGTAVAASGLTGGADFESSVYPFIVRNVSLIGIDTVSTPIAERRAVWEEMATAFPAALLEEIVHSELGLGDLAAALEVVLGGGATGRMLVNPGSR